MYCTNCLYQYYLHFFEVEYPTAWRFNRFEIILSIPSKAPPAIQYVLCVYLNKFWSGCLRPFAVHLQRFLHNLIMLVVTFTRNVTCNRRIVTYEQFYLFRRIQFRVLLWPHHSLQLESCQNTFYIFSYITCFRKYCCLQAKGTSNIFAMVFATNVFLFLFVPP
jgi:hypothetical protein